MQLSECYEILGVEEQAPIDEIRAAFRRLAKQMHPDASRGLATADGGDGFVRLTRAYALAKLAAGGRAPGGKDESQEVWRDQPPAEDDLDEDGEPWPSAAHAFTRDARPLRRLGVVAAAITTAILGLAMLGIALFNGLAPAARDLGRGLARTSIVAPPEATVADDDAIDQQSLAATAQPPEVTVAPPSSRPSMSRTLKAFLAAWPPKEPEPLVLGTLTSAAGMISMPAAAPATTVASAQAHATAVAAEQRLSFRADRPRIASKGARYEQAEASVHRAGRKREAGYRRWRANTFALAAYRQARGRFTRRRARPRF